MVEILLLGGAGPLPSYARNLSGLTEVFLAGYRQINKMHPPARGKALYNSGGRAFEREGLKSSGGRAFAAFACKKVLAAARAGPKTGKNTRCLGGIA